MVTSDKTVTKSPLKWTFARWFPGAKIPFFRSAIPLVSKKRIFAAAQFPLLALLFAALRVPGVRQPGHPAPYRPTYPGRFPHAPTNHHPLYKLKNLLLLGLNLYFYLYLKKEIRFLLAVLLAFIFQYIVEI